MTTASIETHLAAAKNGTALAADALGVPIQARESDGTRGPLRLKATSHEVTVNDADANTALAAIQAALADPATETKQDAIIAALGTLAGYVDGLEEALGAATPAGTNVIGRVGIDQTTPGTTDRSTVGQTVFVNVTLSLDTNPYASGDLLAETQVITNLTRIADFGGVLMSLEVIDQDDQGVAFSVMFLDANVSFGSENSAPSISDANALNILGRVDVATSDYIDHGGVKTACIRNIGLPLVPAAGTRNGYLAVINGTGTPTFTAAGVTLRLGFLRD